nr:DsbA family protein [uncultured Gellertiella sp.]
MRLKTLLAGACLALTAFAAVPLTAQALDDTQKKEFGAFIRDYLLSHPEVLQEAQAALEKKHAEEQASASTQAVERNKDSLFADASDVTLGNPKGDVTVVEFFDYNCGYCKQALPDMNALLKQDNNIRFILKEFPILGPDSVAAHRVADAFRKIDRSKYNDFHQALLGGHARATEARAIEVAQSLGVSEDQIRKMMKDNPADASIKETYRVATELGVSGTPSYVVGTEPVFGAIGVEELSSKVANIRSCGKTSC